MGMTGQIQLTGTITIPLDAQAQLVPLLDDHIAQTRQEPGCLKFEVTQDAGDLALFHVNELFSDEASFAQHQTLGAARPWGTASADLVRDFQKVTL